ncbi:hypothetical protein E8E11_010059 [Didymella keratinophila]|nr:hypothetical protein E8E11_010059 [Didymella keratinophila]
MYLNNYLGRRLSLIVTGVVSIVGVLIEITSAGGGQGRFGQFAAGKTIASIAMGLAVNIVPVYLSETSTGAARGFVVSLYQNVQILGVILASGVVYALSTSSTSSVYLTPIGLQLIAKAKSVVCTIPLNCLGDIQFAPPLFPLRQRAIHEGHINMGAKIHFKLSSIQHGWFASCSSTPSAPFCLAFSDQNSTRPSGADAPWCIGIGYGGQLTDKTNSAHIISSFTENLNPQADVLLYATHEWANDPYAKGVWSCWGPGSMSKYLAELRKSEGRVVFASADWADGLRGFGDGALERGKVAALERGKVAAQDALEVVRQESRAKL